MKIENFVSFPSEKYVFVNFDERNTHFFTYTRASSILVTNEEIKSVPSCSNLCRTNYFHEFLLCSIGTKAIDLIERRNKREIVSPKFLPKMGENLKERYLGEGGGGGEATSNYAGAPFSLSSNSRSSTRLSTTRLLKKKGQAGRQTRLNEKPAHTAATHRRWHTLPTNDSSKKLLPLLHKFSNRPKTCEQTFT